MSATALQRLNFMVSLTDRVSGPAGKMMRTMDTVTTNIQGGFQKIGYGAAGLTGAVFSLDRLIAPAKELDRALGEVKSLDVADSVLQRLTKSSLEFSMQYGESASEFVSSSYDIQSAINGLVGNELAQFTTASAILAKGTKSSTGTITSFVGTMYGIFKHNADIMGKGEWVNQLAGQTAMAVQMFKTTGAEMSTAFGSIGAAATSHGIKMHEQMAILGTLQATMSGTEAGTKYKSFLAGVGKAQETLGLQFTDSQGKMLPMVDILERIKGKFGDIDTVAESDLLQKAFGRKEAVDLIKLLITDVDGLNTGMEKIGQQKGMQKAMDMAAAISDPFEIAGAKLKGMQTVLGKALIPTLLPFLDAMGNGVNTLLRWTELFPTLTKYVGAGVLGIIGLIAAFSVLSIVVGISKFLMVGWGVVMAVINVAMMGLRAGLLLVVAATWLFNAALLANPIVLIVVGVIALVAAVAAAVIYWDTWTTAVVNFGKGVLETIGFFDFVDDVVAMWDKLPQWWSNFTDTLAELKLFAFAGEGIDWVLNQWAKLPIWWSNFTGTLAELKLFAFAGEGIDWVLNQWAKLPLWWSNFTGTLAELKLFAFAGEGIDWVLNQWAKLPIWWSNFAGTLAELKLFAFADAGDGIDLVLKQLDKLRQWFSQFSTWLSKLNPLAFVGKGLDGIKSKLSWLPGFKATPEINAPKPIADFSPSFSNDTGSGVINQIKNASNTSNTRTMGDVVVNNYGHAMNGQTLADELAFAGG